MQDTIVLATHNPGKAAELRALLAPVGCRVRFLGEWPDAPEPEETGATFEENARIKARAALRRTGLPSLADDSGLCVNALGGEPGIRSARFGGFRTPEERNLHLLRQMDGEEDRRAVFVCHIVCLFPDGREIAAQGRCDGEILTGNRGRSGFGYDPLFYLPERGKTFAELTEEEKAAVSHRGIAFREFLERLMPFMTH